MTPKQVLVNIKNYDLWDFFDYKLTEKEAAVVIAALEEMVAKDEREQAERIHKTDEH